MRLWISIIQGKTLIIIQRLLRELFVGDVLSGSNGTSAGIVDQDIDASVLFHYLGNDVIDHIGIGDVAANGIRFHTEFFIDITPIKLMGINDSIIVK